MMPPHPNMPRPTTRFWPSFANAGARRAFDPARPVPRAELHRLFEAARWAPSSSNEQPWRFVVADRDRSRRTSPRCKARSTLDPAVASSAPVLVDYLGVGQSFRSPEPGGANRSASLRHRDRPVGFLTLQATAIPAHAIRRWKGFDHAAAREACGVPESFEPGVVMAVGYWRSGIARRRTPSRRSERQPEKRQPIEEFVFEGKWGIRVRL